MEGGTRIDFHHLVPDGVVGLVKRASGETAGDVHEHVDAPALRDHRLDNPGRLRGFIQVGGNREKTLVRKVRRQ